MSNFTITDTLGLLGNIFAIVFFLIPLWMIFNMIKTKNTSTVPWLLFIFTILNCEFWMIYGLKLKAWPVYICNGVGIVTNHFYLIMYFFYLERPMIVKFTNSILLLASFSVIFAVFFIYIENTKLIGSIACVMNILMFASPLQKIGEVYEKKDNSYIPIHVSLSLVINCCIWILYGCFKEMDYFIIIPNVLGLLLSSFQVYLWFQFREPRPSYVGVKDDHLSGGSDEELEKKCEVKIDLNKIE